MTTKWMRLLIGAGALALASGCVFEVEQGSGVEAEEERDVVAFSRVDIEGGVDRVKIVACGCRTPIITVRGDDNLVGEVETYVDGETLVIDVDSEVWTDLPLEVIVKAPLVEVLSNSGSSEVWLESRLGGRLSLQNSGSGDLTFVGDLQEIDISKSGSGEVDVTGAFGAARVVTSGSGDVEISGGANLLDVVSTGSGDVRAGGFEVREAHSISSGSGNVELCATGSIDAVLSGSGDLIERCHAPDIRSSSSGSGDVLSR